MFSDVTIRIIILAIGWPVLVAGSIVVFNRALRFHREVGRTAFGLLVLVATVGELVNMYSLAIVATFFMLVDMKIGVLVVGPVFLVWFFTMFVVLRETRRLERRAVELNELYRNLKQKIEERTRDLSDAKKQLEEKLKEEEQLSKLMVGRELKMIELKKEIENLEKEKPKGKSKA